MLTHLNGYKREAVLAPLFKMLEATFDLFVPLVMADIVNVGIAAHDFHYILVRCGILLLLAVVGLACSLTAQYFSAKAAVGYSTSLRHALFEHIQRLGFTEMDTMGTSTLITRMTSDINQVQSGLNLFLRLFLRSPFVVVGAMIMAFTVNVRAAWIFVVAIPLLSVVVFGVMVITNPLYKTAQARLDRVLGLTRENLTGVRVVRAFDKEQSEIDRFESANDLLTRMQLHVGHISSLMSPLTYVIINLAIVALLYVGSIEINVGGMASGDVIALVNYMNQILVELVKLANLIVQVSKALACAGRVQAVLDTEPGMEFPAALKGEAPADKAGDAVRFDHVSLTYAGAGAPSLTDISFTAKRGQTIGVIGGKKDSSADAKPNTSTSQTQGDSNSNGGSSSNGNSAGSGSNDLNNLDDALQNGADDTNNDLNNDSFNGSSSSGKPSLEEFVNSSEIQSQLDSMTSSYQGMGISIKAYAEGNTLVYDYTLSDTYSSMGDMMTSSLDGMDSTFKSVAQTLNETCDTGGNAKVRVYLHTESGKTLFDKSYTE